MNDIDVAQRLSQQSRCEVNSRQYRAWLDGTRPTAAAKFAVAVRKFIGKKAYKELDTLGRLDAYLLWKLGLGPKSAGGVVFEK